jgi:UDPglucose 6-dehydrogenase
MTARLSTPRNAIHRSHNAIELQQTNKLHTGGPTAAVVAFQNPNIQVTVVDRDTTRIRRWNSRHPPIYEPGLHDIVRIARDGGRPTKISNEPTTDSEGSSAEEGEIAVAERKPNLFFSTDIAKHIGEADIVLVAVNTPTKYRGVGAGSATDMTAFEAVTGVVAQYAREGAIIVEKSTVPCRTAQLVADTVSTWSMLQQKSGQMLTT